MKIHSTTSIHGGILALGILGLTAITSHAAVVTWGAAKNITGDSDVVTTGTVNQTFNFGAAGVASTTVNGVTFTGIGSALGSNALGAAVAPFSNLSASYQALLSTGFAVSNPTVFNMTPNLLTVGRTYLVQLWSNASIAAGSGNLAGSLATLVDAGNTVSLNPNASGASGGLGQYVTGTFVADNTFQTFNLSAPAGGNWVLNGAQIRDITAAAAAPVPEPGSALVGLLALGVCLSGVGPRNRRPNAEA